MLSSKVPQAGTVADLGLVGQVGYTIYRYNNNGVTEGYQISTFDLDELVWLPSVPTLNVGQAFLLNNDAAAATWTRMFSVN